MVHQGGPGAAARADDTTHHDDVLDEARTVDLTDPRLYATDRPERIWRTFRRAGVPVRSPGLRDHWAITRHAQIREILKHSHLLSSAKGNHLGEKATDVAAGEAAGGMSLLVSDGPVHAAMRRVLGAAFTPKLMHRLTASTEELARQLVSQAAAEPSVDFVQSVAAPLPAAVICDMLGVPASDRDHVIRLTQAAFGGSGHVTSGNQMAAHTELFVYCAELIAAKRRRPGEDVATVLATAEIDGRPMSREMAVMNCHDLIAGGNETARHTSSAAAVTMVTEPAFWRDVRGGQADMATATDELLRHETPVNHMMRVLLGDIEIAGVTMRRGEFVTFWVRSANRDEDVFDDPDEMRATRRPNPHLGFGFGAHYCIAAMLARIEVGAIVRALAEVVGHAELVAPPVRLESNFFRGYRSVRIALRHR
ncbi:Cytochrome P450 [Micromonospora echinospora]|uniref:Cytochrome P450 n=1 Tax=Micromonospora echinospora TaxID=1877 RepID=A0A1C4YRR8_MICEC|nr:cytochrome P450 [Micromonospora echinospora]SCF23435.1 Cytochrome P450 [Micromonospora echinospora]